jgi:hypothetical protein
VTWLILIIVASVDCNVLDCVAIMFMCGSCVVVIYDDVLALCCYCFDDVSLVMHLYMMSLIMCHFNLSVDVIFLML